MPKLHQGIATLPEYAEQRENIRRLYRDGMPATTIAKRLRMGKATVQKIVADIPDPHGGEAQRLFVKMKGKQRFAEQKIKGRYF